MFEIADEVTVLRDGRNIATLPVDDLDHERLIELMVGHAVERKRATQANRGAVLLDVGALCGGNLHGVDVQVHAGEIVGVAGINGSGREHIVPLITGQVPSAAGTVELRRNSKAEP